MSSKPRRAEKTQKIPVQAMFAQALQHHQAGRLVEAEHLYQQVLAADTRHADSLQLLGVLSQQTGRGDLAIDLISRAIAINPRIAAYHANLGKAFLDQGRLEEANAALHRALGLSPHDQGVHNTLGDTLRGQGRPDEAAACYRRAISIGPQTAALNKNLADLLKDQGCLDEAVGCYRRALDLEADDPETYNKLGLALGEASRLDEAAACFRRALALKPDDAHAHNNLGNLRKRQGRLDEAIVSYGSAIALRPDYPEGHFNLAVVFQLQENLVAAGAGYRRALDRNPDYAEAHACLAVTLTIQGQLDEALRHFTKAIVIRPNYFVAFSNLLFIMNYRVSESPESLCDVARQFGVMASREVAGRAFTTWGEAPSGQTLRVGLVSGDLWGHAVTFFLEGLLHAVDPARIAFVAFPSSDREDEVTARIKPLFTAWQPIHGLSDEAAANLIHASGVQVLLDLSGHTAHNRLPVFAWRPAPVQATWLGYFATTGVAEMDYIIGDPWLLPPTEAAHFTETAWPLPNVNSSFTPPDVAVEVSGLPALANNCVTFGCFNNPNKINDAVVEVWARVLHAVPSSRLMLKSAQFNAAPACRRMRARFAAHGVAEGRLLLDPASPRIDYLRAYHRVDIALDPFPYPGGTTSLETLWMGVPLLTKKGDRYLAHVGETVVQNAGLPDWVAENDDDYVAKAVHFAADIPGLATLRAQLRPRMLASPLCDSEALARQFEAAMEAMWSRRADKKQ